MPKQTFYNLKRRKKRKNRAGTIKKSLATTLLKEHQLVI